MSEILSLSYFIISQPAKNKRKFESTQFYIKVPLYDKIADFENDLRKAFEKKAPKCGFFTKTGGSGNQTVFIFLCTIISFLKSAKKLNKPKK